MLSGLHRSRRGAQCDFFTDWFSAFEFPSVLWRRCLGDRMGIWPVKILCRLSTNIVFSSKWRGKQPRKSWLTQVCLENCHWNGDGVNCKFNMWHVVFQTSAHLMSLAVDTRHRWQIAAGVFGIHIKASVKNQIYNAGAADLTGSRENRCQSWVEWPSWWHLSSQDHI